MDGQEGGRAGGHLVGVDVGTQSAKVEVVAPDGTVLASGTRALRPTTHPRPGAVEHPNDDLWDALGAATRQALAAHARAGHDPADLAGVGLCGIRSCRAVVAADGTLASPVQSWMDERVGRAHEAGDERWVTASSGYLTLRLTGAARDSVAAYRGLWPTDLHTRAWSTDPAVLGACGTPPASLVDLVEPGDLLGRVTADAAAHTDLPAGLPVVATANDKAVEALGCGLADPDDVLVSLGTYAAGMVVGGGPGAGPPAGPPTGPPTGPLRHAWTNFAATPGGYLHESVGVRRAMWTVSWVRELAGGGRSVADLDAEAARLPPGADGLLAVPDWLAPLDAPHRRGALVGFDARHGPAHLHRAVLEGLACVLGDHVEAMLAELGRGTGRLLLSGGGGASAVARQAFAGVLGRPVVTPAGGSPAARGAAICAAVGVGVHPGFDAAIAAMVPPGSTVGPGAGAAADVAAYADLRTAHRDLRAALEPVQRRHAR